MPVRLRLLLLPVLVATAALVAAGCSVSIGDKTIDAGSVEDQISQNLESQGEEVDAVECPGDQKAEQGTTFECDVTFADGTTRTAQIELVDDEGTFNFTSRPTPAPTPARTRGRATAPPTRAPRMRTRAPASSTPRTPANGGGPPRRYRAGDRPTGHELRRPRPGPGGLRHRADRRAGAVRWPGRRPGARAGRLGARRRRRHGPGRHERGAGPRGDAARRAVRPRRGLPGADARADRAPHRRYQRGWRARAPRGLARARGAALARRRRRAERAGGQPRGGAGARRRGDPRPGRRRRRAEAAGLRRCRRRARHRAPLLRLLAGPGRRLQSHHGLARHARRAAGRRPRGLDRALPGGRGHGLGGRRRRARPLSRRRRGHCRAADRHRRRDRPRRGAA